MKRWLTIGFWVTIATLGLSTESFAEVFAKRLRDWEKAQHQRYLTSYRGWMKAVESGREQHVVDYQRDEKAAIAGIPSNVVNPDKLVIFVENEARTRSAYFVSFSAAVADCYTSAVNSIRQRAETAIERGSLPESEDELDCPKVERMRIAEQSRRSSVTTMASLSAGVKELAEDRARKAKEEEAERVRKAEIAAKKKADEEAAALKKAQEEEARQKKMAEEEAAKAAKPAEGEAPKEGKAVETSKDQGTAKPESSATKVPATTPPKATTKVFTGSPKPQLTQSPTNVQPARPPQQMQPPVPIDRFGRPLYYVPAPVQRPVQPVQQGAVQPAPPPPGESQPKPPSVPLRTWEGRGISISWVWDGHLMSDYQWNRDTGTLAANYVSGSVSTDDMDYNEKGQLVYKGRTLVPNIYLPDQAGNMIRDTEAEEWHNAAIKRFVDAKLKVRRLAAVAQSLLRFDKLVPNADSPPINVLGGGIIDTEPSVVFSIRDFDKRFRNKRGLKIVDKEGFIANPAIRYDVHRNNTSGLAYLNLAFFVPNPRVNFDLPCTISETGTWKYLSISRSKPSKAFYISIYPDRDTQSEQYEMTIQYWESNTAVADSAEPVIPQDARIFKLPLVVEDQDKPDNAVAPNEVLPAPSFPYAVAPEIPLLEAPFPAGSSEIELPKTAPYTINLDFRLDRTGFFSAETSEAQLHRKIFARAALDWSYFIGDMNLKPVRKNEESTGILFRRLVRGEKTADLATYITNGYEYEGMLFHVLASEEKVPINSMGGASGSGLHKSERGYSTELRRSGEILFEGVHRADELVTDMTEENWWKVVYKPKQPVDLYSLAMHEFGHGLCFDETYGTFGKWLEAEKVGAFAAEDYQGQLVSIDPGAHLSGQIDRESQRATFGEKEDGRMPQHRWLITQLDLLLMQKNGYRINPAGLPLPPVWRGDQLTPAVKGIYYKHEFTVSGGIPDYSWRLIEGRLPAGLSLDTYDGTITGTPTEYGEFHLVFSFRDSSNQEYGAELRHYMLSVTRR